MYGMCLQPWNCGKLRRIRFDYFAHVKLAWYTRISKDLTSTSGVASGKIIGLVYSYKDS
jgi:uncharacterized membrane protein